MDNNISIKNFITKQFYEFVGYKPNIDEPKSFNEKIQWLKLHYHDPLLTKCTDKYEVREYIKDKIGEQYLIPLLGVYESVDQIDFEKLPNKFVLKTNNASGRNIICENKKELNIDVTKEKLKEWLKPENNYYFYAYEWAYKNIKPKIICEEFIETPNQELKDYKFMCFHGKIENIFVCTDRKNSLKVNFYDTDWKLLPFIRKYPNDNKKIIKPKKFNEMLKISEFLSKEFPFVRVDLYEAKNKIYFGELTFYPGGGLEWFKPKIWDYKIGKLLNIEKIGENNHIDNNYPKIDIILPTFNRASKIKNAIQSIIDQTYPNWVLYIINDGGEDISKVIEEFKDERIKYYNTKHTGKPGALNFGLKHSSNPYITYMDDDDIIFPQHLEILLTAALGNKKDFVYSDTYLTKINESTGKQINQTTENNQDVTYEMLRFKNYINHKQILHTRKLYEKIGEYDEKLHILIDWDYIKRLAKEAEPYHIKTITGNHFLYVTKKQINSITGLWTKNPQKVGDSLTTIFAKDSLAMIDLFQKYHQYTNLELQKQDLVQKNNQLELNKVDLYKKIDQLESTVNELCQKNDKLKADLDKIQSSKTYKLWQKYNKIKKIFSKK